MAHRSQNEPLQPAQVPFNGSQHEGTSPASYSSNAASEHIHMSGRKLQLWQRLEKFVGSFVTEIETKFEVYQMLLEDRNIKTVNPSSSVSKELGHGIGSAVGCLLGYFLGLPGGIGNIGGKVGAQAGRAMSTRSHSNKQKCLSQLIYYYQENKEAQRKILIEAGFQIFKSFEFQIMHLKGKKAWQTYVIKLGQDAAHRTINFCAEGDVDRFTVDLITKGVLQGKSKKGSSWPPMKRGMKIKYQGTKVTTEDIFTNVGLVNLEKRIYYTKKGEKSNESNCGYRILFSWELGNSRDIDIECSENYERKHKPPENEYNYAFNTEKCSEVLNELTTVICSKEVHITEETMKQILQDLKDDIVEETTRILQVVQIEKDREELRQLKEQIVNFNIDECVKQLQVFLEEKLKDLQYVTENDSNMTREHISQEHEETRSSIQKHLTENNELMRRAVEEESNVTRCFIFEELEKMRSDQGDKRDKSVTLDFSGPVEPFIGRKEELKDLHTHLHKEGGNKRVVVSGLGGVGKSELARMYAAQHYKEYNHNIVWINGGGYNSLHSSFIRLAEKLGVKKEERKLDKPTERRIADIVSDIYDELGNTKCLFIFDDAQKYRNHNETDEGLRNFLPGRIVNEIYVIITSSVVVWDSSIPKINLKIFKEVESLELLKTLLGNKYEELGAKQMGKQLDHHPLALQIAAAYINDQDITIHKFIAEYDQKELDILELDFPDSSVDNNTKTIFTTFQVTLEKISHKGGEEAITILKILAYLTPDYIPQEIFLHLGEEIKIRNAIQTLKRYSMIIQKPNGPLFEVHKLVQEFIRKMFKDAEEFVLGKALDLLKRKLLENSDDAILQQAEHIWHYAGNYPELIKQYQHILKYPLHRAAQLKKLEMVQYLIEEDCVNIYARDKGGMTALYRANQQDDNMEVIKYLIQESSQHFNTRNKNDWKILEKAAEVDKKEVLQFLICESFADQFLEKNILLHIAAQKGRLDVVMYLVNNGADVLFCRSKVTVLHEAVYSNNNAVIEFVLDRIDMECKNIPEGHKYFINAKDRTGDTALMWAAKSWKIDAVKALRNRNVDISVKNKDGKTALDLAKQTADELLG